MLVCAAADVVQHVQDGDVRTTRSTPVIFESAISGGRVSLTTGCLNLLHSHRVGWPHVQAWTCVHAIAT